MMAKMPDLEINLTVSEDITVLGEDGETVWKGPRMAFGFMVAALRSDLVREWRCWREDGTYGPPCRSPDEAKAHTYSHRHSECCWIVYYEQRNELI